MKTQKEIYLHGLAQRNPKAVRLAVSGVKTTSEEAYAELNRLHAAPDRPDPEVLGKFSL